MQEKVTSAIEMSRFLLSAHRKTKHQYCQSLQDNGHARWNNLSGINLWYQYLRVYLRVCYDNIRIAHSWHHNWLYTITVSLFWCSSVLFELWLRTNYKRCRILEWHRTPKSWWRHQMETFPRNWPFVREIHRSRWIPHTKASDAELWCLLWSAPE